MRSIAIIGVLVLGVGLASARAAEPVTTCGQRVNQGVLTADLDCSGGAGDGVQVEKSLSLGGFQMSIGNGRFAVHCVKRGSNEDGRCQVFGPGTIAGTGIGARSHGLQGSTVTVRGVSFNGNLNAIVAPRAVISGCDVNAVTGSGVWAGIARVSDTQIVGSGRFGIAVAVKAILKNSDVSGSVLDGITSGGDLVLKDSTVVNNAANASACQNALASTQCTPAPQPWLCADVSADGNVKLTGASACDRSLVQAGSCGGAVDYRPGDPIGVCAGD